MISINSARHHRKPLQWGFAAVCAVWVGWYFYHNRQGLELFTAMPGRVAALLLGLFTLHLFLYTYQFYVVLRHCAAKPFPFWAFFKTIILGRFLSSIAPQAGGVFRAIYLKTKFNVSYTHYISGFFAFLWIDAAMNICLSACVIGYFDPAFAIGPISAWWILAAMAVCWFVPIGLELLLGRCSPRWRLGKTVHRWLSEVLTIAVTSIRHRKMLAIVAAANLLNFVNNIVILRLCLSDTAQAAPVPILAMFFILLKITSYLIITPGNLGVREIAYAFLGSQLHLDPGRAMALSILYRIFGMIVTTVFGIYFGGIKLLKSPGSINSELTEKHSQ